MTRTRYSPCHLSSGGAPYWPSRLIQKMTKYCRNCEGCRFYCERFQTHREPVDTAHYNCRQSLLFISRVKAMNQKRSAKLTAWIPLLPCLLREIESGSPTLAPSVSAPAESTLLPTELSTINRSNPTPAETPFRSPLIFHKCRLLSFPLIIA